MRLRGGSFRAMLKEKSDSFEEERTMDVSFGESLRRLRVERGLTQQQLAQKLHIDRGSIASWETGHRIPSVSTIMQIAQYLGADVAELLGTEAQDAGPLQVILVDDMPIILGGGIPVLRSILPGAVVSGFTSPDDAMRFARENLVSLAFLDIELGRVSGIDVCRELLAINPRTNVIFLTAYRDYAFDAWQSGACGFLLKPLTEKNVREQLLRLRYPIRGVAEP